MIEAQCLWAEGARSIIAWPLPVHLSYIWVTGLQVHPQNSCCPFFPNQQSSVHPYSAVKGTLAGPGPRMLSQCDQRTLCWRQSLVQGLGLWARYEPALVPVWLVLETPGIWDLEKEPQGNRQGEGLWDHVWFGCLTDLCYLIREINALLFQPQTEPNRHRWAS